MDPYRMHLAVVACREHQVGEHLDLSSAEFHGTAFCIAPELFITAGHVYEAAAATGVVALGRLGPVEPQCRSVLDAELYKGIDLALMRCPDLGAEILPIDFGALTWLADVFAFGFPFGLELADLPGQPHHYQLRAFKGHVVNRLALRDLPAAPPGYEVSFVPPPGLSGAPLLCSIGNSLAVKGVMLKHRGFEQAGRRMDLGLAVGIEELLTLESKLVGGSIAKQVFQRELIQRRNRNPEEV